MTEYIEELTCLFDKPENFYFKNDSKKVRNSRTIEKNAVEFDKNDPYREIRSDASLNRLLKLSGVDKPEKFKKVEQMVDFRKRDLLEYLLNSPEEYPFGYPTIDPIIAFMDSRKISAMYKAMTGITGNWTEFFVNFNSEIHNKIFKETANGEKENWINLCSRIYQTSPRAIFDNYYMMEMLKNDTVVGCDIKRTKGSIEALGEFKEFLENNLKNSTNTDEIKKANRDFKNDFPEKYKDIFELYRDNLMINQIVDRTATFIGLGFDTPAKVPAELFINPEKCLQKAEQAMEIWLRLQLSNPAFLADNENYFPGEMTLVKMRDDAAKNLVKEFNKRIAPLHVNDDAFITDMSNDINKTKDFVQFLKQPYVGFLHEAKDCKIDKKKYDPQKNEQKYSHESIKYNARDNVFYETNLLRTNNPARHEEGRQLLLNQKLINELDNYKTGFTLEGNLYYDTIPAELLKEKNVYWNKFAKIDDIYKVLYGTPDDNFGIEIEECDPAQINNKKFSFVNKITSMFNKLLKKN